MPNEVVDGPGKRVPVGAVVLWWGNVNAMPKGYELCDGELSKEGTRLHDMGIKKPEFRSLFPRGPHPSASSVTDLKSDGKNKTEVTKTSGHVLSIDEMPSHSHSLKPTMAKHGGNDYLFDRFTGHPIEPQTQGETRATESVGANKAHDHEIPEFSTVPEYQEIFFIIRVD